MYKRKVQITETILRDAHQSMLATRMKTEDMLPIAEKLDQVGYFSIEMWGGATYDVCMRFLDEDPWERLRLLRKKIKNTKLQMLLRGQNLVGYRHYADDVVEEFVKKAFDNGIDVFRIFDAVNDIRNMEKSIIVAKSIGAIVEGTLSYTVSPVHTIEKYIELSKNLKELGVDIICIKDMAGFITPQNTFDLIKAIKESVGLPIHLHCHCSSGTAPMVYYAACQAGVDILDTAISPLAWGTSQPPTESIVGGLQNTPFDTGLDLKLLAEVRDYFKEVKQKYLKFLDPISERVDTDILLHQTPGGMLSNLVSQLKEQNSIDKYEEVLKEIARVRKDLGYPPLVTPTSQIVGTQAVFNVIMEKRYKMISKEVKDYIKGFYGKPPGEIDPDLKKLAIGDEEPITCRPADLLLPELEKARLAVRPYKQQEEDVLLYAIFPQTAISFFEKRKSNKLKENNKREKIEISGYKPKSFRFLLNGKSYDVYISQKKYDSNLPLSLNVLINNQNYDIELESIKDISMKSNITTKQKLKKVDIFQKGDVIAPMSGNIIDIRVSQGDRVNQGDILLILEAMKMQNEIQAPISGIVKQINPKVGDVVEGGSLLINIEEK